MHVGVHANSGELLCTNRSTLFLQVVNEVTRWQIPLFMLVIYMLRLGTSVSYV